MTSPISQSMEFKKSMEEHFSVSNRSIENPKKTISVTLETEDGLTFEGEINGQLINIWGGNGSGKFQQTDDITELLFEVPKGFVFPDQIVTSATVKIQQVEKYGILIDGTEELRIFGNEPGQIHFEQSNLNGNQTLTGANDDPVIESVSVDSFDNVPNSWNASDHFFSLQFGGNHSDINHVAFSLSRYVVEGPQGVNYEDDWTILVQVK